MTETQTTPVWTVATDETSRWLSNLSDLWTAHNQTGWQFVVTLRDGINDLSRKNDKSELYELVANQCDVSTKRLKNLVSMARRESSMTAMELGLEIAHAENVLGLDDEEATSLLYVAAEQRWTPTQVSAEVRSRRGDAHTVIPADGNENNLHDVPFDNTKSNVLYEDSDYSAEANAYAGDAAGYEFEPDDIELTINEARALVDEAWQRLARADVGHQRTMQEWLYQIGLHAY